MVDCSIHDNDIVYSQSIGSEKISNGSTVGLRSKQDQTQSRRAVDAMVEKKDGESLSGIHSRRVDSFIHAANFDAKKLIDRSLDNNMVCSRSMGNDKFLSKLAEYGKSCSSVSFRWRSLRSIAKRVSLRWASLRTVSSSFAVKLDRVKVTIGQMYRQV